MFVTDFTWKMNITNPLHNIGISFFIFSTNTQDKQQGKILSSDFSKQCDKTDRSSKCSDVNNNTCYCL